VLSKPCKVPLRLSRIQYIDFTGGWDLSLARLGTILGKPIHPGAIVRRPWYQRFFCCTCLQANSVGCFTFFSISVCFSLILPLAVSGDDETARLERLVIAIFWVGIAAFVRWLGRLVDCTRGAPRSRSRLRRLFLLYWPGTTTQRALPCTCFSMESAFSL